MAEQAITTIFNYYDPEKQSKIKCLESANKFANDNGRYGYAKFLGQGGFGTVLRACDVNTGEDVAIKLFKVSKPKLDILLRLKTHGLNDAVQEADMLRKLKHKNIVELKTHFKFKEDLLGQKRGLAIVMEFCPNGSLQAYIDIMRLLIGLSYRKEWYMQLSSAVQYIHSQHIVHLDIKPDNILLDEQWRLKIADVGLATSLLEAEISKKKIELQSACSEYLCQQKGTKPYMAPEVFKGHYDMRCDIFSLGLVFVMIARNPSRSQVCEPLTDTGESLGETLHVLQGELKGKPTSLLQVSLDHLPEEEVALFNNMLNHLYNDRSTIESVLQAIEHIKEKPIPMPEPEPTPPPTPKTPEPKSTNDEGWCVIS